MGNCLSHIPPSQMSEHLRRMKQAILWCIFYREEEINQGTMLGVLTDYFQTLQQKLFALNDLLGYPPIVLDIIETLQAANQLYQQDCLENIHTKDGTFPRYRKLILDARSLVDKIGGEINAVI